MSGKQSFLSHGTANSAKFTFSVKKVESFLFTLGEAFRIGFEQAYNIRLNLDGWRHTKLHFCVTNSFSEARKANLSLLSLITSAWLNLLSYQGKQCGAVIQVFSLSYDWHDHSPYCFQSLSSLRFCSWLLGEFSALLSSPFLFPFIFPFCFYKLHVLLTQLFWATPSGICVLETKLGKQVQQIPYRCELCFADTL